MRRLSGFLLIASSCFAQIVQQGLVNTPAPVTGGSSPAYVTVTTQASLSFSSSTVSLASFTATTGNALFFFISYADGSGCDNTFTVSSKANGSASGDTFTLISLTGAGTSSGGVSQTFQCSYAYLASAIHGGSYVITATESGANSQASLGVIQFSGVSTLDKFCYGSAGGGTSSVTCNTSMTPSTSPEVLVAAMGDYYFPDTPSASTGFTIPTGTAPASGIANSSTNGNGTFAIEYKICASGCGTAVTPSFSVSPGSGGSNYSNIIGATIK